MLVTIGRAEKMLGVSRVTLYRWLRDGFITGEQMTPGAPWQIRIDQALRDKIRPQAPDGRLSLDRAAKALGVARQTRTPQRPAYPGQTPTRWTVRHTRATTS